MAETKSQSDEEEFKAFRAQRQRQRKVQEECKALSAALDHHLCNAAYVILIVICCWVLACVAATHVLRFMLSVDLVCKDTFPGHNCSLVIRDT